jgi:hypothetical protein
MHISSIGPASEIHRTELPVDAFLLITASLPAKKRQTLQRKSDIIGMDAEISDGCGHRTRILDVCGRCSQHRRPYHEDATSTPNRESVVRRVWGTRQSCNGFDTLRERSPKASSFSCGSGLSLLETKWKWIGKSVREPG